MSDFNWRVMLENVLGNYKGVDPTLFAALVQFIQEEKDKSHKEGQTYMDETLDFFGDEDPTV